MSISDRKEIHKQIYVKAKRLELGEAERRNTRSALRGQCNLVDMRTGEQQDVKSFLGDQATSLPAETAQYLLDCFCDSCAIDVLA